MRAASRCDAAAVWWLAETTLATPPIVGIALAAGWVLMPAVLVASLTRPRLRYALVLPATLVGVALLAVSIWWLLEVLGEAGVPRATGRGFWTA